jgi:hypothetical protein
VPMVHGLVGLAKFGKIAKCCIRPTPGNFASRARSGGERRGSPLDQGGVAQVASHCAEHVVERWQRCDLLPQSDRPELSVARLLRRKFVCHRVARSASEREFVFELGNEHREIDVPLGCQMPQIVEVTGFVSGRSTTGRTSRSRIVMSTLTSFGEAAGNGPS